MPEVSRYFDHAATTPLRAEAFEAMTPYLVHEFGNPNSLHGFGYRARAALDSARATIAKSIGAVPSDIVFTGSGTEANNMAVLGAARRLRRLGKGNHVITTAIEHPSVLYSVRQLEREGFSVTFLQPEETGRISAEQVGVALRHDTVLVSVMHANNVVGTLQPVAEIGSLLRPSHALFHCDAVQTYGKIPVDVEQLNVDFLTVNAHKIGGPKGVAALYLRKGTRIDPLVHGGGQERGLRSATQNVAGIVGFARAAEAALVEHTAVPNWYQLRQRLIDGLTASIPGLHVNGHPAHVLPTVVNVRIDRIEGQALMLELDRLGFGVSSGSACSSHDNTPSYVLLAMGQSEDEAIESLRITMGWTTTADDVDLLIEALARVAQRWRVELNA